MKKKIMFLIVNYAIAVFLVIWLLKNVDIDNLVRSLSLVRWQAIGGAVLIALLFRLFLYPHLWHLVLKFSGMPVRFFDVVKLNASALPLKFIMPFKLTEIARAAGLSVVHHINFSHAISSVAFVKMVSLAGTLMLVGIGSALIGKNEFLYVWLAVLGFYAVVFVLYRPVADGIRKVMPKLSEFIGNIVVCFERLTYRRKMYLCLYAVGVLFGELIVGFIMFRALHVQISFFELLCYLPIVMFGCTLPVSIQGVGVRETLTVGVLASFASKNQLFAGALLISTIYYMIPSLVGVIVFFAYSRSRIFITEVIH